jgi:predicted alpha/beta hydrolase family esterase
VGHSLGCLAIVHWTFWGTRDIQGALLVAPTDVEREAGLDVLKDFAPIPRRRLPFPSILAASNDDPFMGFESARALAEAWGSRLVDLGPCGHVNAASGYGEWPRGEALLQELR